MKPTSDTDNEFTSDDDADEEVAPHIEVQDGRWQQSPRFQSRRRGYKFSRFVALVGILLTIFAWHRNPVSHNDPVSQGEIVVILCACSFFLGMGANWKEDWQLGYQSGVYALSNLLDELGIPN